MFGHKHRKDLKEEAIREGLTPTKDLEVDESELSEEEKGHYSIPWPFLIVIGILLLVIIVLVIVIIVLNNQYYANHPELNYSLVDLDLALFI